MEKKNLFLELNKWREKGKDARLLGHNIFYIDEYKEDAPTIFLIHGFPTSSWDWQPIWNDLKQNYRLVCLDMLGFGYSDKPRKHTYSIHEQADIVEALAQYLGLKKFHILTHDYGVSVVQELMARQVDKTNKNNILSVCFLNGGLFPESHHPLLVQKILLSPLGFMLSTLMGRKQFNRSFSSVFSENHKPSKEELAVFWHLINFKQGKIVFHKLITYMSDRKIHRERWVSALQNANIPIALLNGSLDPVSGKHIVTRYKELNCRMDYLAEFSDLGHYPQVEAPDLITKHYLKFLKQHT